MITAVTGSADGHALVLTPKGNGWQATLPPDLADGQYVVTLTAVNEAGNTTDYRGVLYLCEGICKLALQPETLKLLAIPQEAETAKLLPPLFSVRLTSEARLDVALCWRASRFNLCGTGGVKNEQHSLYAGRASLSGV